MRQSGGQPRDLEDPATRIEDLRSAVDFLTTLDYIDDERIGILGICAAGGYTISAAMTDHRIKAAGTVVAVNIGRAFRQAATTPDAMAQIRRPPAASAPLTGRETHAHQLHIMPFLPGRPARARW